MSADTAQKAVFFIPAYYIQLKKYMIIFINCNSAVTRWQWLFYMYEGYSNENHKSAIKIKKTARFSCKLTIMILMI
jgi:hypothetical protein